MTCHHILQFSVNRQFECFTVVFFQHSHRTQCCSVTTAAPEWSQPAGTAGICYSNTCVPWTLDGFIHTVSSKIIILMAGKMRLGRNFSKGIRWITIFEILNLTSILKFIQHITKVAGKGVHRCKHKIPRSTRFSKHFNHIENMWMQRRRSLIFRD